MYHLEESSLRVCGRLVRQERNRRVFANSRFIILQHLMPDTEELIGILRDEGGAEIHAVLPKPYSINREVLGRMMEAGYDIFLHSYGEMEETSVLDDLLRGAALRSAEDGKKIGIIDIGGYFADPLSRLSEGEAKHIAGIVEDTTFGHYRYESLIASIPVPVFSVARSRLKEIEARAVGEAAALALDIMFRDLGTSLSGRNALVVGYGMIGKNVARSLRSRDVKVSVYDIKDHRNLAAFSLGFGVNNKMELLRWADMIVSCTGARAVAVADIELCKDNVVLASVGSKDIEFDVQGISELSIRSECITESITKYVLPTTKAVFLVRQGTAVNFVVGSVPSEVMDLVFAEILLCSLLLLKDREEIVPSKMHTLDEKYLSFIAKNWLKFINH